MKFQKKNTRIKKQNEKKCILEIGPRKNKQPTKKYKRIEFGTFINLMVFKEQSGLAILRVENAQAHNTYKR